MKITFNFWEKFGMTRSFDGLCPLYRKHQTSNIMTVSPLRGQISNVQSTPPYNNASMASEIILQQYEERKMNYNHATISIYVCRNDHHPQS